jgi:hypothetical protein
MRRAQLLIVHISVSIALTSCSLSVRPVYNDQEQALARNAVDQFHDRYNRKDYDGLYAMMAEATQRAQPKEIAVSAMQQTVETWGREQSSSLAVAKVFPGPPVQVRMIYNTTYEKGKAQEWFIWTSDGKQSVLLQYQIFPGSADEKTIKAFSSP